MNAQKRNNSSHRVMNRIIVLIGVLIIGAFIFTFLMLVSTIHLSVKLLM